MHEIPKTWNILGTKYHLVGELRDDEVELVVYKYWRPQKQRWQYCTELRVVVLMEISGKFATGPSSRV